MIKKDKLFINNNDGEAVLNFFVKKLKLIKEFSINSYNLVSSVNIWTVLDLPL